MCLRMPCLLRWGRHDTGAERSGARSGEREKEEREKEEAKGQIREVTGESLVSDIPDTEKEKKETDFPCGIFFCE